MRQLLDLLRPTGLASGRGRALPLRDVAQEMIELGPAGLLFRLRWELGLRSGWTARVERPPPALAREHELAAALVSRLPFADAGAVRAALQGRIAPPELAALAERARGAERGRIRCFGRWFADYGDPIDWHANPVEGHRWDPSAHWSEVLKDTARCGDVKFTWEVGRFPHAYELARAAAFGALPAREAARALAPQFADFVAASPYGRGVHWASSQEIVVRLAAWLFAISALRDEPALGEAMPAVVRHLHEGAVHLERYFDYARKAVYNNHLVSEAFGLYLAGTLLAGAPRAARWKALGLEVLGEQADRQVYPDGGYMMNSHNYQRAALQMFLLAAALRRKEGAEVPRSWSAAMARSVDFLFAHQNPADGRLPNFGSNDGALMAVLSTCDYSDFRPLLQALSLVSRGERLYEPGPWDEEAAWLLGPAALDAPLRPPRRSSRSFPRTGSHVLRGRDPGSFASFRCGTLHDRFTQVDMLHVDVFWRGANVLVDGGTYLYSGPSEWVRHFTGGASHNTVTVDGHDQMVHHRRFKVLYLTRAKLLRFEEQPAFTVVEGEHYGFRRHPGGCVHRRSVLQVGDDLWVVADRISGVGAHSARIHWLGGPYPHRHDGAAGRLELDAPAGEFSIAVLDRRGLPLSTCVVSGSDALVRGWYARYYGEKVAAPSLAAELSGETPLDIVSVLGSGKPTAYVEGGRWTIVTGAARVGFEVVDGRFSGVSVGPRVDLSAARGCRTG